MAMYLDRAGAEIQRETACEWEERNEAWRAMRKALGTCAGTPARRLLLLAAIFITYFGSIWLAAMHFPHGYDWRRNVISNLLSPRDNPDWYRVPSAGVALAGLCMWPLAVWMEGALGDATSKLARRVRRPAFIVGMGCLSLSALVAPQHAQKVAGLRHAHEALARVSAGGLGIGMLCACRGWAGDGERRAALRKVWRLVTVPAVLGGAGSGIVLALTHLHWLGAGLAALLRTSVVWRLAFWEWVGSGVGFLFFAAGVGMLRGEE
jgi:hypothetical protein